MTQTAPAGAPPAPVFCDRARPPAVEEVADALGACAPHWDAVRARVATRFAPLTETWAWSGAKHGWALRLAQGKRPIVYLAPCAGYFRASAALREDAVAAALASDLSAAARAVVATAPSFPEGRAVRIEVRDGSAVADVVTIVELRMTAR
ncbi:MAG: DUF3788 family protein [Pseudomonadota bacterium]|nr:DUF3788 family protein [Pseudomonadota bacterium]